MASRDFFGTAYGQDGETFEGFQFGDGADVVFDDTLLLIDPEVARAYEEAHQPPPEVPSPGGDTPTTPGTTGSIIPPVQPFPEPKPGPVTAKPKVFHASAEVPTATARMRLVQIADEIVSVLASDPNASIRLVVEISVEFPEGASDTVKRAVSENARSLELKNADWE